MKVEFNPQEGYCTVYKEAGDPRFSGVKNGAGESRLFYHLKRKLNNAGHDFIKKRMAKDGHMVDDMQQYLRQRTLKAGTPCYAILNDRWVIEEADEILNETGSVTLRVIDISPQDAEEGKDHEGLL